VQTISKVQLPYGVLRPRHPAPTFKAQAVIDETFVEVKLNDYEGEWLVLMFYPFDFTFVCPTELVAFSEASQDFEKINTKIAAVSTDSQFTHLAWTRTPRADGGLGKLRIPLIADVSKDISAAYGVLVVDPEDPLFGAALRGIFIIDPKGTVRSVQVNDENVGRSVSEVLRLVKAFQYADSHGEGCPANWQPGDEAVKPDPKASKAFFAKWSTEHAE